MNEEKLDVENKKVVNTTYIDKDFNIVTDENKATLVKFVFDDGSLIFAIPSKDNKNKE